MSAIEEIQSQIEELVKEAVALATESGEEFFLNLPLEVNGVFNTGQDYGCPVITKQPSVYDLPDFNQEVIDLRKRLGEPLWSDSEFVAEFDKLLKKWQPRVGDLPRLSVSQPLRFDPNSGSFNISGLADWISSTEY